MKKLFLFGCLFALTACSATSTDTTEAADNRAPTQVNMQGMSNEDATDTLLQALVKANYLADKVGPNRVAVQLGERQFVLQPSMNPEGIDRILANRFFAVHPQLQSSKELLLLIGQLNQKLNFAKFFIRENGAIIQVQSSATFVGTMELEELRRFLLWTDEGLLQVAKSMPADSEKLIKPIPVMQHPQD